MDKVAGIPAAAASLAIMIALCGCHSDATDQAAGKPPSEADKQAQMDAVKNNPNIPPDVKARVLAIEGSKYGPYGSTNPGTGAKK